MNLGEMHIKAAAKSAAGNWKKYHSFVWFRAHDLDDADNWAVIYTHNRDSSLLDQSNAHAIEAALDTFTEGNNPDVVAETHSHWAVGWVQGFSVRVFKRGRITRAFRKYHELAQRLAVYPILDDEDYSHREYEDTLSNLADAAWRLKQDYELPDDWETAVYAWFSDHDYSGIENRDDRGGYPTEDQLRAAFNSLGFGEAAMCEV
ncbi:MAG: hypothetical protein ACYC4N_12415 [Pirellulaceae bacterium]